MIAVIDENTLISVDVDDLAARLKLLGQLIDAFRRDDVTVYRRSEIYTTQVMVGVRLYEALFGQSAEIDRDTRMVAELALERSPNWDEQWEIQETYVDFGDGPEFAPTVAFAHARLVHDHQAVGCIGPAHRGRIGEALVRVNGLDATMVFVTSTATTLGFYRYAIEVENPDEDSYFSYAQRAFPDLTFVDGLAGQFGRFSQHYRAIRPDITRHLAALNDCWRLAFKDFHDPAEVQMRMAACGHIDISPESPQTRRNHEAMRQRRVDWHGERFYCEWHAKISPTVNRIHFHPPMPSLGPGPIIGIFADHLLL